MTKKLLICLILSIFLIGFVSAADLPNLVFPDDFKDVGDGVYIKYDSSNLPEQTFAIIEYTQTDAGDYLLNDTEYGYKVYNSTNDTYNFVDEKLKEKGSIELVEINGVKYIIESWNALDGDDLDFTVTFDNLLKLNKLNNLTPLNATEIIEQELTNQTK